MPDALGQEAYFDKPFDVGFTVAGFEFGLLPDGQAGSTGPQSLWGMEEIDSAYARLLQLRLTQLDQATGVDGNIKVAAVHNPYGNHLGSIENPHFDAGAVC